MTFEEWKVTLLPFEAKALTRREIFQAGAASRDAEVVSLTNQRDYEYVRAENAEQERDQLREQVKMLRDGRRKDWRNEMKEPVFCKDCKWAIPDGSASWSLRCINPKVNSKDSWALSSRGITRGTDCNRERGRHGWFTACGIKGKQWELNEKEL